MSTSLMRKELLYYLSCVKLRVVNAHLMFAWLDFPCRYVTFTKSELRVTACNDIVVGNHV